MAHSKKDLARLDSKKRKRIEELEAKARLDPLHKNPAIHEELAKLKSES